MTGKPQSWQPSTKNSYKNSHFSNSPLPLTDQQSLQNYKLRQSLLEAIQENELLRARNMQLEAMIVSMELYIRNERLETKRANKNMQIQTVQISQTKRSKSV